MKLEGGKEIEDFSTELAIALVEKFHIMEWVTVPRVGMTTEYVDVLDVSDFIQQFIGDRL